jgi:hypothetical protein
VTASADGQVIESLRITSTNGPAISVNGYTGVVIRNVEILHDGGPGIQISNAADIVINNVSVEHSAAPATGANAAERNNIQCLQSARLQVDSVRLTRGSTGIYLDRCDDAVLRFVEGHDFRGPIPRGQLVQFNNSHNGLLEDFSVINPVGSWSEDNVNVYQSTNVTIRRGHIDGNNSPSGVGVIFDGGEAATGLVEDVDAIRMGNGCFSNFAGGTGVVFRRTRCRENICIDQGRGLPSSNALMWAGNSSGRLARLEDSQYFAACNPSNLVWPASSFEVVELQQFDFVMRPPIQLEFCWEN